MPLSSSNSKSLTPSPLKSPIALNGPSWPRGRRSSRPPKPSAALVLPERVIRPCSRREQQVRVAVALEIADAQQGPVRTRVAKLAPRKWTPPADVPGRDRRRRYSGRTIIGGKFRRARPASRRRRSRGRAGNADGLAGDLAIVDDPRSKYWPVTTFWNKRPPLPSPS